MQIFRLLGIEANFLLKTCSDVRVTRQFLELRDIEISEIRGLDKRWRVEKCKSEREWKRVGIGSIILDRETFMLSQCVMCRPFGKSFPLRTEAAWMGTRKLLSEGSFGFQDQYQFRKLRGMSDSRLLNVTT